jgi:hypothetical protein
MAIRRPINPQRRTPLLLQFRRRIRPLKQPKRPLRHRTQPPLLVTPNLRRRTLPLLRQALKLRRRTLLLHLQVPRLRHRRMPLLPNRPQVLPLRAAPIRHQLRSPPQRPGRPRLRVSTPHRPQRKTLSRSQQPQRSSLERRGPL